MGFAVSKIEAPAPAEASTRNGEAAAVPAVPAVPPTSLDVIPGSQPAPAGHLNDGNLWWAWKEVIWSGFALSISNIENS